MKQYNILLCYVGNYKNTFMKYCYSSNEKNAFNFYLMLEIMGQSTCYYLKIIMMVYVSINRMGS